MKELKEKLLCAIKSNIECLAYRNDYHIQGYYGFKKINGKYIILGKEPIHVKKTVERTIYPKYFWQKEKIKEVEDWVFIGFKGIIKMQDYEQIDITIEEYNEIIKLHEEKSLEKDLKTLSNLCNNE